jgi:hypothetical protein
LTQNKTYPGLGRQNKNPLTRNKTSLTQNKTSLTQNKTSLTQNKTSQGWGANLIIQ